MYRGPGALDLAEEPEGEDAHGQTDDGDHHAQLGDPRQDVVVSHKLMGETVHLCDSLFI